MAIRWLGPSGDFKTTARMMDRVFDQFLGESGTAPEGGTPTYTLPIDIIESDDSYHLLATIAGVSEADVEVTLTNGMLSILAKAAPFELQGKLIRQERPWGHFHRNLELPPQVDAANISADFDNGVLRVRVPKAATAKPVRIAVGTAGGGGSERTS